MNEKQQEQILQDITFRQEQGIGDYFTGPKGVLSDFKFHQLQEQLRKEISYLHTHNTSTGHWQGTLKEINFNNFVESIELEDPETIIVLNVYHPDYNETLEMNRLLSLLAKKHTTTKFIKIHADQLVVMKLDPIAYTTLLIYQNKDLVTCLTRVQDEIVEWSQTGSCSLEELESYLYEQSVLCE